MLEYFADGELAPDGAAALPSDPTLNNVGSLERFAQRMREHGVATLALRVWHATGEREQHFVAVATIEIDTLKEVCAEWLYAKYGQVDIRWMQSLDERKRSEYPMVYWHAKFKALPKTVVIE